MKINRRIKNATALQKSKFRKDKKIKLNKQSHEMALNIVRYILPDEATLFMSTFGFSGFFIQ